MSLKENIKKLHELDGTYYYNNVNCQRQVNLENINNDEGWNFIDAFFREGEKTKAFDVLFKNELIDNGKHIHSITMYYLGVILKDIIADTLRNKLKNNINDFDQWEYDFTYTWYLTSLFHDTASVEENNNTLNLNTIPKYSLEFYLNKNDVIHDLFSSKYITDVKMLKYNRNLIENYFYYCLKERDKVDHGIISGFILYDRLVKNYEERISKEIKGRTNLSWRETHLIHFAYIADAIICHNIWFSKDVELYKRYGLKQLVKSKEVRIKRDTEPLLFLLGIVDTIEPTKFYTNIEPFYVWENIDISYNREEEYICIKLLDKINKYEEWFNKIKSLESWIDVTVEVSIEEKEIRLSI